MSGLDAIRTSWAVQLENDPSPLRGTTGVCGSLLRRARCPPRPCGLPGDAGDLPHVRPRSSLSQ
jgi:hypothetical protein